MKTAEDVLNAEYLIFSAHKTATQSIKKTLQENGFPAVHCHHLTNIGMDGTEFSHVLEKYKEKHGKPLKIVSVFREPIERHMSSFFQVHGWQKIYSGDVDSQQDTLIHRLPTEKLHKRFLNELDRGKLKGRSEAILMLRNHLGTRLSDLQFSAEDEIGVTEFDKATLYLYRFDQLIPSFVDKLSSLTGTEIEVATKNMTEEKWYNDRYKAFKSSISIPRQTIDRVYRPAMVSLAGLMYGCDGKEFVDKVAEKYSA